MLAQQPAGGPTRSALLGAAAVAIALAACSKEEPRAARPAAAPTAPSAAPAAAAPATEVPEALKERLARQEAAAKLFEKAPAPAAPPPPPPPAAAKPALAEARAPAPKASPSPPPAESAKTAPAKTAPATAAVPRPAEAKSAAAPPPAPPPAAAPKTDLAAAKTPAPPAAGPARLLSRVDPDFPREAIQAGADRGNVKARMTLDAEGNVTRVDVLEAQPRRFFDRAVMRALSQWKFSEGAAGRTVETEVEFRR